MTKADILRAIREYVDEGEHSPSDVPDDLVGILADLRLWIENYDAFSA